MFQNGYGGQFISVRVVDFACVGPIASSLRRGEEGRSLPRLSVHTLAAYESNFEGSPAHSGGWLMQSPF
jgi:hypothetical protein